MQASIEDIAGEDSIGRYIVALAAATREHPHVLVGASPRGSLALLLLARARAALGGRDYVIPEDVKEVAVPALGHRITLRPEMWLRRVDPAQVVHEVLERTPAPASGALPTHATPTRPADVGMGPGAESGRQVADPYRYTAPPRS